MPEYRRILLDGAAVQVRRHDDPLVAADGREAGVDEAIHLPPTVPTKIIAVHLNYASRTKEFMTRLPAAPTYFHKPTSSLNSHRGAVVRPERCKWLNFEGEIVIVIGRTCRNVSPDEVGDYLAGYTVGNDYGLHDFRDTDAGSMLRVKGSDTLAPVGPGLVTDWDFHGKTLRTLVNGEVKQKADLSQMIWSVAEQIEKLGTGTGDLGFFPLPEPMIMGPAQRVMSLRDGTKKMSKSDTSDYSRINLTDDADAIAQKIRKAKTDPEALPSEEKGLEGRPEAENLVGIYAGLSGVAKSAVRQIGRAHV